MYMEYTTKSNSSESSISSTVFESDPLEFIIDSW